MTATLPGSARAAVLVEFGAALEIREFPILAPPPGGLLVEIEAATVCGSDVHNWTGHTSVVRPPVASGHEGVGRIVALGEGADVDSCGVPLRRGDRVVWGHAACGSCHACTVLRDETLCRNRYIGMLTAPEAVPHLHGTFATHAHVHPRAGRVRVPEAIPAALASASSCALRSVMAAFDRLGALDHRHTVVIQGAGPLGLFATAVAAASSPHRLVVIGAPQPRLDLASTLGADAVVSIEDIPDADERARLVRDLTDGRGADVVLEFAGSSSAFAEGVELAAPGARIVMAGASGGRPHPVAAAAVIGKNLTVVGSLGAAIGHYAEALSFLDRFGDRVDWSLLVGPGTYTLDDATTALRRMRDAAETKAVIVP